jgi:tRNA pseudouridine38-40 synthase
VTMVTTRLDIEYDGSGFRGWAAQPGLRTVQGELEPALATTLGEEVSLTVAGRTDAGVHAWGQVASFQSQADPEAAGIHSLARSLNGLLPDDVSVTGASRAADGFDARRDARSRTYCYRVRNAPAPSPFERGRSLWRSGELDRDALRACAEALHGTHDFTAFTPTETDHVRFERDILRAEWVWEDHPAAADAEQGASDLNDLGRAPSEQSTRPEIVCFWIEADAFMRNMVRVLVGTMLEVAAGQRKREDFVSLLDGAPRERAGETAPAHGLYLASVRY